MRALEKFGAPLDDLKADDLAKPGTIFQIGLAPRRIDVITGVSGLDFDSAYSNSVETEIEGLRVKIPSIEDLIINKKAAGRTKDLADAEALESLRQKKEI